MSVYKVKAVQDGDGHWYVIPNNLLEEFHTLRQGEFLENEFNEKFSEYMTGGDLNLIQLYADLNENI